MNKFFRNKPLPVVIVVVVIITAALIWSVNRHKSASAGIHPAMAPSESGSTPFTPPAIDSSKMPIYGNWRNFTTKDGLPSDKAYTVRIDGKRVLVGTHEGLAVYENGKWQTYTTKDGLSHNGVVSIDVSDLTGDVWIGTLGGLTRWSGGKFTSFTQFNSGLPNDLVYCVICDGKDVWVATGGGAGDYDTKTGKWGIYTEMNAPMHEPWTYGVSAGDGKIFIAAWGGESLNSPRKPDNLKIILTRTAKWKLTFFLMMEWFMI